MTRLLNGGFLWTKNARNAEIFLMMTNMRSLNALNVIVKDQRLVAVLAGMVAFAQTVKLMLVMMIKMGGMPCHQKQEHGQDGRVKK